MFYLRSFLLRSIRIGYIFLYWLINSMLNICLNSTSSSACGNEIFVIRFGVFNHQVLHRVRNKIRISLATFNLPVYRVSHVTGHGSFRRKNCTILNNTVVLQHAPSSHDSIFPDVNVRSDLSCRHDGPLANVNMVPDLQRKERHTLAELLVRRAHHRTLGNNTVSTRPNGSQISPDYSSTLHNHLTVEDDILRPAQDRLPADLVAGSRFHVLVLVVVLCCYVHGRGIIRIVPTERESVLFTSSFTVAAVTHVIHKLQRGAS